MLLPLEFGSTLRSTHKTVLARTRVQPNMLNFARFFAVSLGKQLPLGFGRPSTNKQQAASIRFEVLKEVNVTHLPLARFSLTRWKRCSHPGLAALLRTRTTSIGFVVQRAPAQFCAFLRRSAGKKLLPPGFGCTLRTTAECQHYCTFQ